MKYLNPILWFRWIGQFLVGWAQSVAWRQSPRAIPALLLLISLVLTAVIALNDGSSWRTDRLNRQWFATLDAEDYETAELVVMRQLHMRPEDSQLIYRLALVRDARGETQDAIDLMWRLVRIKREDAAARWLLEELFLGRDWAELNEREREDFGSLLALIHAENPTDIPIQQLYADYLIATDKYARAIPVLSDLMTIQPMRGLQAAALSRKLGNQILANRMAERTLDRVAQMSQEDPTNSKLALAVAQNQLFLMRYGDAIRTLELAFSRAKDEEVKRQLGTAVGDAYVAWIHKLEESPTQGMKTRLRVLRMLEAALVRAPHNPRVLTLVADKVLATTSDDNAEVAEIRQALIDGSSAGIAHFIRGTAALLRDDLDSATTSLQLAAEHMPRSASILNNLAVALAARDDSKLEQALRIAESAIRYSDRPTPYYYETRGQILVRLGRYFDAIPDLERALRIPALAPAAHQSLAECYRQIGDGELSLLHHQKAEAFAGTTATAERDLPR